MIIIKNCWILGLFLILSESFIYCSTASNENIQKPSNVFVRTSSVSLPKEKSFLSALLMSLYSVPTVQNAFIYQVYKHVQSNKMVPYSTSESSQALMTLSLYFGKKMVELRRGRQRIPVSAELTEKLLSSSADDQSISWPQLFQKLSSNIKSLFNYQYRTILTDKTGKQSAIVTERNSVTVLLNGDSGSLSDLCNIQHEQNLPNDLSLNFIARSNFNSYPPVFAFEIARFIQLSSNSADEKLFLKNLLKLEKVLVIEGITYRLASRIEFDETEQTYSGVCFDFNNGLEYTYNHDGTIKSEKSDGDHILDRKSVLVFYVKDPVRSIVNELTEYVVLEKEIVVPVKPATIQGLQQLNQQHQPNETNQLESQIESHKRKFENLTQTSADIIMSKEIYRPVAKTTFPEEVLKHLTKVDAYLIERISRGVSAKFLDFQAKLFYKSFKLGSRNFSFKVGSDGKPFTALEIFLTSLATNSKIVENLFALFDAVKLSELQQLITFTIIKMLLGCTQINLEKIVGCLHVKHGFNLKDIYSAAYLDIDFLYKYHQIVRIFDLKDLVSIPKGSKIKYSDLTSDDPVSISTNQITNVLKPASLIEPRNSRIKGLWFDQCDKKSDKFRKRTIFKSDSEVFFVNIDRRSLSKPGFFDTSEYSSNGDEYSCVGVVSVVRKESGEFLEYLAIDSFFLETLFRSSIPGQPTTLHGAFEANINYLKQMLKLNSVLLFYVKNIPKKFELKTTQLMSAKLAFEVCKDYLNDLNSELNQEK